MESLASSSVDSVVDLEAPARKPKRVLHFSDGTLEEYSDDDELHDPDEANHSKPPHDPSRCSTTVAEKKSPRHMGWGEYLLHVTMTFGVQSLNFCDWLGEKFAWGLGITTPKYGYAIDEREWRRKEEAAEKAREDRERTARAKRNAVGPDHSEDDGGATRGNCGTATDGLNLNDDSDILASELKY